MNACIVSFFMNNIDMKTVGLQRSVVEKYNPNKIKHHSIKVDAPHGVAMDFFFALNGFKPPKFGDVDVKQTMHHDVILVLDIDCIPLQDISIDYYLKQANDGKLIGNAQRSGHIENGQHVFAAPSAVALSTATYDKIGRPSANPTERSDVCEEYTWEAEKHGVPVDLLMPVRYDRSVYRFDWEKDRDPHWSLGDGKPNYGIGTTFGHSELGDLFWHSFQIFHPGNQEKFWEKCEEVLNG